MVDLPEGTELAQAFKDLWKVRVILLLIGLGIVLEAVTAVLEVLVGGVPFVLINLAIGVVSVLALRRNLRHYHHLRALTSPALPSSGPFEEEAK